MSGELDRALRAEAEALRAAHRCRELPAPGRRGIDFTSSDYLDLASDPRVVAGAIQATEREGAGGRAARLLGGGGESHVRAEAAAARWLDAEAALLFPSGYQANLALIGALAGRGDALVCDALVHASAIDAARLSRARVIVHAHGDLVDAERALREASGARRRIVLSEGVFSMDGDRVDLVGLAELCARHDAWLVVDEAHSAGLLGDEGRGAWHEVQPRGAPAARLAARLVTGGKALGCAGAFVVGSRAVVDAVVRGGRGFLFTTAPQPALAGALEAAIGCVRGADLARERCLSNARRLAERVGAGAPGGAIVPLVVGGERDALEAAARLVEHGFDVRAVRPPTVPVGAARLRLVARSAHTHEQIDALAAAAPRSIVARPTRATPRPLFVVGTDTGVGKTVVAALVVAALRASGVRYWKPVQTGDDDDTRTVARLAALAVDEWVEPLARYALPASPHEAAAAQGARVPVDSLSSNLAALLSAEPRRHLVVELAGGLLVPYDGQRTQGDWVAELRPRVVLVARSGLGTLNHTLLTAEALARRGVVPDALVLVGPPHPSNRATLAARMDVPVLELPPIDVEAPLDLAREPLATLTRRIRELLVPNTGASA